MSYSTCHNKVSHQHPCIRIWKRVSDGDRNRRPRQTGTGIQVKWVRVFETNGYGCPTDLERATDKTGTDCTMAVGSSRECWHIPAIDTYVQV